MVSRDELAAAMVAFEAKKDPVKRDNSASVLTWSESRNAKFAHVKAKILEVKKAWTTNHNPPQQNWFVKFAIEGLPEPMSVVSAPKHKPESLKAGCTYEFFI